MIVYGKPLAEAILINLQEKIKTEDISPHLAIILAGNHPSSRTYIKYKQIAGEKIGIKTTVYEFAESVPGECLNTINALNSDQETHGIIIQLPVYTSWPTEQLVNAVYPAKDVDGFLPQSPFIPATADGTWEMLKEFARLENYESAEEFLKDKKVVVLGKGKTAGKPIRDLLTKKNIPSELIDTKTENPDTIISQADVIISATGKKHIINGTNVKDSSYVIGVGVGKEIIGGEEKPYGDVNEEEIIDRVKLYCPTIGGIGPLTVACLLRNVVTAASAKSQQKLV